MGKRTAVADGVEYLVEEGLGHLDGIEWPTEGKVNAHVAIAGDRLQRPVRGWLNVTDHPEVADFAREAAADGRRIRYRVEIHRSAEADPAVPMAEVDQFARFRRLTLLEAASATPSAPGTTPSAPTNGHHHLAAELGPPVAAEPPAEPEFDVDGPGGGDPGPTPPNEAPSRGPRLAEGRPWEELNSDGSPNLGSYAYGAVLATVELAHELLVAHAVTAGAGDPLSMGQVASLARTLLGVADEVQAALRPDGRVDRMDASHTRARGALRSALEAYPVPFGAGEEDRQAWRGALVERATALGTLALALHSGR